MDIFNNQEDPHETAKWHFTDALSINYNTAERANVAKQNCGVCPRHWYFDAIYKCKACGIEFTFSAKEQRFWYEDLKFYVGFEPQICLACRKMDRGMRLLKQQYDHLIAEAITSKELSKKTEVVGILDELTSVPKHRPHWKIPKLWARLPPKMNEHRELLLKQIKKLSTARPN